MVKPDRGKTKTIKDRAIYVYLPSLEMVEDWKKRAERAGVSISRFVIERVEDSIRREEGEEGYLTRVELIKRLKSADEEPRKLRDENRLLRKLVENLDGELKRYRARPVNVRDSRAPQYVEKYGDMCWEVEALDPNILLNIVESRLKDIVPTTFLEEAEASERASKIAMRLTKGLVNRLSRDTYELFKLGLSDEEVESRLSLKYNLGGI